MNKILISILLLLSLNAELFAKGDKNIFFNPSKKISVSEYQSALICYNDYDKQFCDALVGGIMIAIMAEGEGSEECKYNIKDLHEVLQNYKKYISVIGEKTIKDMIANKSSVYKSMYEIAQLTLSDKSTCSIQ